MACSVTRIIRVNRLLAVAWTRSPSTHPPIRVLLIACRVSRFYLRLLRLWTDIANASLSLFTKERMMRECRTSSISTYSGLPTTLRGGIVRAQRCCRSIVQVMVTAAIQPSRASIVLLQKYPRSPLTTPIRNSDGIHCMAARRLLNTS